MITVNYCGYHTHNVDQDLIFRPSGTDSYLFLLVLAPMKFSFKDGTIQYAKPGACILYSPRTYQHYQSEKEFFNSFVHFYIQKSVIDEYSICQNALFYPDSTEELNWLLKKIHQEFVQKASGADQMLSSYVEQLLVFIHRIQHREENHPQQHQQMYLELLALREQMLGSCHEQWTIHRLCDILNIGKSQLYKYYELFFHSSPKEELIQARLQKARFMLTNEAVTIKQAAYDCGFCNINHFNRLFKQYSGCNPTEYRKGIK